MSEAFGSLVLARASSGELILLPMNHTAAVDNTETTATPVSAPSSSHVISEFFFDFVHQVLVLLDALLLARYSPSLEPRSRPWTGIPRTATLRSNSCASSAFLSISAARSRHRRQLGVIAGVARHFTRIALHGDRRNPPTIRVHSIDSVHLVAQNLVDLIGPFSLGNIPSGLGALA